MATKMREHILSVSSELFSTNGINATSVDTIVSRADIAKVTLYKYFKSKEELILEYLRQYDEKMWAKLSSAVSKQKDSVSKIKALTHGMLDWIGDSEFNGFASINASVEFPLSDSQVNQNSLTFAKTLRGKLSTLAHEAGWKNADAIALQLAMVIEGAAITKRIQKEKETIIQAKSLVDILIESAAKK